jgi:hypothetical protein
MGWSLMHDVIGQGIIVLGRKAYEWSICLSCLT